jgi:hypothetical protein
MWLGTLKKHSDVATNVLLAVTCIWVIYTAYHIRASSPGQQAAATKPLSYQTGDRLDLPYLAPSAADRTVVLFVRSGCRFCTDSMPFYDRLTRDSKARFGERVRFVVITPDDGATAASYLRSHGVTVDQIVPSTPPPRKIWATPTVVITSRNGLVDNAWTGQLDVAGQLEVRRAIGL